MINMKRELIDNPYSCPLIQAMNVIGGKWKPIIVHLLSERNLRFGKLALLLNPISRKVLTQNLKELEADEIILKKELAGDSQKFEYTLTKTGKKLVPILDKLSEWSAANLKNVFFETV